MNSLMHWTAESAEDFRYKVAYDFVNQVEFTMEGLDLRQADLAARLNVTPGRVSQFFNNPGNMSLKSMVEWARVLGRKVAVVLYDDGDAVNTDGPVHSEVFRLCWERLGKPNTVYEVESINVANSALPSVGDLNGVIDLTVMRGPIEAPKDIAMCVNGEKASEPDSNVYENLALAA